MYWVCPLNKLRRKHKISKSSTSWSKNGPVHLSDFKEVVWTNLQEQEGCALETRVGMQRMT